MNDFKKEYKFFKKDIDWAVKNCLNSGRYILGENVTGFEKEFAKYINSKYCIGVGNGMEALQIALMAVGVSAGDEVITVSNSAVATALAISNIGATPVFVDIDKYYHMDVKEIEQKITPKTRAIIPVHLFGQIVDIKSILKIAKKYNLKVIEDACQAHGAAIGGKKSGSFGDLGCFSFYPTKNLGGYGDGGAIVTDSYELYQKCQMFRNYGQSSRYEHEVKGLNSRLDELQAAILRVKLKKLDSLNKKRQKIAKLYTSLLKGIEQIRLPETRANADHIFHLFVIRSQDRNNLQKFLKDNGIETLIHYPIPIHKQKCYEEFNNEILPKTQKDASEILSLPIHPFMSEEQVKMVCEKIKRFYNRFAKTSLSQSGDEGEVRLQSSAVLKGEADVNLEYMKAAEVYKNNKPTVSVAVSAYNEQYNIISFLESVLSQKENGYTFEEVLVISDGSDDQTPQAVDKFIKKLKTQKKTNNPKIVFINDQQRIGKSSRLNEMFSYNKSDFLILADADVIFANDNVIKSLIDGFKENPNIGLVGGAPFPLKSETFWEKCVNATFEAYLPIRQNYKDGNSILSATGRIMALKKEVAQKITVAKNTISNDGFIYFSNLTLGYEYRCAQEAIVFFRSPQDLKDQLNQNTRFQATHAFMKKYFPANVVDQEYFIPKTLLFKAMLKQVVKHPILSFSIFAVNRYCQLKAMIDLAKINALWEVVYTSKKLKNI